MKPTRYDHAEARRIAKYVKRRFRQTLPNGALSYYLLAMPELEESGLGLCRPITANYQTLANAGLRSTSKLRDVLHVLNGVLCQVELGEPVKGGGVATTIRRFSIGELEARKAEQEQTVSSLSARLAVLLGARSFPYGDKGSICPKWKLARTGRVQSSQPNVQSDAEDVRAMNLASGCQQGEVVHSLDFRQAEPTLIRHLIGWEEAGDIYSRAAGHLSCDRQQAKRKVNALAYCRCAVDVVGHWPQTAQREFMPYAEALDRYKEELWESGKPRSRQRRHVITIAETRIEANRGERPHRGQILNWRVQGSVADITNAAALEIIEREAREGWRFAFPCHDSVYVIARPEQGDELKRIMLAGADRFGVPLEVRHTMTKR